jgi:hypothetical protein
LELLCWNSWWRARLCHLSCLNIWTSREAVQQFIHSPWAIVDWCYVWFFRNEGKLLYVHTIPDIPTNSTMSHCGLIFCWFFRHEAKFQYVRSIPDIPTNFTVDYRKNWCIEDCIFRTNFLYEQYQWIWLKFVCDSKSSIVCHLFLWVIIMFFLVQCSLSVDCPWLYRQLDKVPLLL